MGFVDHRCTPDVGGIGRHCETVVGHLVATVPCQGMVQFLRQLVRPLDQGIDHCLGILAVDLGQHHVACVAFDQCRDVTVVATGHQIAFPIDPRPH